MPYISRVELSKANRTVAHFEGSIFQNIISTMQKVRFMYNSAPLHDEIFDNMYEITFQTRGMQIYEIESTQYELSAGKGLVCFPKEHHGTGDLPFDKTTFYYIIFNADELFPLLCSTKTEARIMYDKFRDIFTRSRTFVFDDMARRNLDRILEICDSEGHFIDTLLRDALADLFISLINDADISVSKSVERLTPATDFIVRHRDEYYTLDVLAKLCHLSRSHFTSAFVETFGVAPREYITRDRIEASKELLRNSDLSVTDIAMQLAFSSLQHFSATFRKYTYMTPTRWRERYR